MDCWKRTQGAWPVHVYNANFFFFFFEGAIKLYKVLQWLDNRLIHPQKCFSCTDVVSDVQLIPMPNSTIIPPFHPLLSLGQDFHPTGLFWFLLSPQVCGPYLFFTSTQASTMTYYYQFNCIADNWFWLHIFSILYTTVILTSHI